ncbi:MAG: DUF547 domain-containing protein [Candidatus Latescibacteria bacterium]|nr:DUF547 domain-containing protein [Candidatus Latescibacterota bacterium]
MRLILSAAMLIVGTVLVVGASQDPLPFSHASFDQLLQTYVDAEGRVDYLGLQAASGSLGGYLDSLASVSPTNQPDRFPGPADELAYWINAYNAFVLWGVVQAYPVDSVKDIALLNGFFRRLTFRAGGQEMTLDHIENKIIRPLYQEPRIHFVVNCGAVSCPPLGRRAMSGEKLDEQLQQALEQVVRNSQFVRLDPSSGTLHLSKIFDWFGGDFIDWFPADQPHGPNGPTLVDYLLPYLPAATDQHLRQHPETAIVFDDYDWALNSQPSIAK